MKPTCDGSNSQPNHRQKHQRKICRWPGQSHPRRAAWMPPLPQRVEGRARPSKHGMHGKKRQDGDHNHAPGFAPHVGHRVQRNLSAEGRRFVASHFGHQSVRGFVTRCGKEKRNIPNESENEKIGIEIRQGIWPFRLLSPSRLEVVAQLCKPCLLCDAIPSPRRAYSGRSHERKCSRFGPPVVNSSHGNQKEQKEEAQQA